MRKIIAIILLASLAACGQVSAGHRGVFTHYGKPTSQVGEGLQWYNPITYDLIEMDVRQQKWESKTVAYTKDVQQATIEFALTYHLNPSKALVTYRTIGEDWSTVLIPQVVQQAIKDVIGQSRAVEDAINNRESVTSRIANQIALALWKRNIVMDGFQIQDISFEPAFEDAVERKQIATQDAETAKNHTVEIQEKANQRIISAKADAEAMKIKTDALAGNAKLVEYEAVQKWDGHLPENMYGSGAIPFIPANH